MDGSSSANKKNVGRRGRVQRTPPAPQTSGFPPQQQFGFQSHFQPGVTSAFQTFPHQQPVYQQPGFGYPQQHAAGAFQQTGGFQHSGYQGYQEPYIPTFQGHDPNIIVTQPLPTPSGSFNPFEGDEDEDEDEDDSETPRVASNPTPPTQPESVVARPRGKAASTEKAWTDQETDLLLKCYMKISLDSEHGTSKKRFCFWNDVLAAYEEAATGLSGIKPRTRDQLRCKWKRIAKIMQVWSGSYNEAVSLCKSGESEDDIRRKAQKLFQEKTNKKFTMIDEWNVLKMYPKWAEVLTYGVPPTGTTSGSGSGSKRPRDPQDLDDDDFDNILAPKPARRPQGRDAARAARRAKGKGQSSSVPDDEGSAFVASLNTVTSSMQATEELERMKLATEEKRVKAMLDDNWIRKWQIYENLIAKPNRTPLDEKVLERIITWLENNPGPNE